MPDLSIGQFVTFRADHGPIYCGNVVSFDAKKVTLTNVKLLAEEGGRPPNPNPPVFVLRTVVTPVDPVG
jgi:hypothetical protein